MPIESNDICNTLEVKDFIHLSKLQLLHLIRDLSSLNSENYIYLRKKLFDYSDKKISDNNNNNNESCNDKEHNTSAPTTNKELKKQKKLSAMKE